MSVVCIKMIFWQTNCKLMHFPSRRIGPSRHAEVGTRPKCSKLPPLQTINNGTAESCDWNNGLRLIIDIRMSMD